MADTDPGFPSAGTKINTFTDKNNNKPEQCIEKGLRQLYLTYTHDYCP